MKQGLIRRPHLASFLAVHLLFPKFTFNSTDKNRHSSWHFPVRDVTGVRQMFQLNTISDNQFINNVVKSVHFKKVYKKS